MVKVEINGTQHALPGPLPDTSVDTLRERLGLTGTKLVCGAGVCGACTVLLDGQPVVSCLLPTDALDGHTVTTVEGIDPEHPVARAFVAHGALQCGFCTPGFVVEAAAFHDDWRARHGTARPEREEIAAALAGHLCRCGAYVEIFDAVAAACAGEHDNAHAAAPPRVEAAEKVTGRARYTLDVRLPGQLEGVVLRSAHAHARVGDIDTAAAERTPGVRAVVRLLDARDPEVRYVGEPLVAIAAVDRHAAEAGAAAVVVRYEPLPASVSASAALRPDPAPVYTGKRRTPNAAEGVLVPTPWKAPNLRGPVGQFSESAKTARRLLAAAREAGDPLLVEGTFHTAAQVHTAFEPHVAVADWTADGLTVHASTQAVAHVAHELARRYRLRPEAVRVLAEHVGGGFGAKLALSHEIVAAVELSRAAGAPVRVALDRLEELSVAGHRPAAELTVGLLAAADGSLAALSMTAVADSGVAVGSTVASLARLIYPAPAKDLADYDVVTNTPPGTPFRGPGGPLTCFALEQAVDEAALRLDTDPIALRRRWDPDPLRQRLYTWAAELPAWRERGAHTRTGRYRRGVGVAAANWFYWHQTDCEVELAVLPGGRLRVASAVQDMGTGSRTVLARTVAGAFDVPPDAVEVRIGDSALPRGPISGGSRTTATLVPATLRAARRLKAAIAEATRLPGARPDDAGVRHAGGVLAWPDALRAAQETTVTARRPDDDAALGRSARRPFDGAGALGAGMSVFLRATSRLRTGRGYTGSVYLAEVEVDTRLGHVRVPAMYCGIAVGRLAAPELAAAQAHGAVIQGIGYALYEQRELDPHTGRVLTAGLEDYRIPGIADTPRITLHFDEDGFEHVPGGGVGLGEIATMPVAAAIANAVHHATGQRPYRLPIRPDAIVEAVARGDIR
ncbi:xanthine dehydrogenase [Virgisporangium aliadipatigenens]|uniref:Xanthine dehydrogenase n=1 Tax=Virgisporangium aliadipatigenens TaxID=741659 RepID=A0A8J3YLS3_9ACTN|nr:molybdopterin-dependent oxidoreductase [Virgisporangium aliadipatigenens]GIJ46280.1 xanthine dehydrogenase [Virgisporangium aliadipatigenens]